MLVKENSVTKIIENEMGFKFKDLDPIRYLKMWHDKIWDL